MSAEDAGFAAPPFKPEEALQRLKRELRDWAWPSAKACSSGAAWPWHGCASTACNWPRPSSSGRAAAGPRWRMRTLDNSAAARDFSAEVKRALQQWGDRDD